MTETVELYRSKYCFACGTDNHAGLNMAPKREGNRLWATFTPRDEHRGYAKVVHGGITCTILDELTGLACSQKVDAKCATVEITVKLKRPVLVGVELLIEARFLRRSGRYLLANGKVTDPQGRVLATCHGKFLQLDENQVKRFVEA